MSHLFQIAGLHLLNCAEEKLGIEMPSKRELRFVSHEVRAAEGNSRTIKGYAAVFNSLSENLGGFVERIAPRAFERCLQNNPDVRCLVDHEPSKILGRTSAKTLRLKEDNVGLAIECDLPNNTLGDDTLESIRRGDLREMSFGFSCVDEDWSLMPDGTKLRTVSDMDVFDVSVVTFPAYQASSVGVARSLRSLWPDGQPEYFAKRIGVVEPVDEQVSEFQRIWRRYFNLTR